MRRSLANALRKGNGRKSTDTNGRHVVGTEATALGNLEKNKREFCYPEAGFVTRIEYSLLYSMIDSSTEVYPEKILLEYIAQEDFDAYLYVNSKDSTIDEYLVSYAQLSAMLALAVSNFPPSAEGGKNSSTDGRGRSSSNNMNGNNARKKYSGNNTYSVSQALCKAILQCVIKYSEKENLDRKAEIEELTRPVAKYTEKLSNKEALNKMIPLYVGYGLTLMTANPLPVLAGGFITSSSNCDKINERCENMQVISADSNRRTDVEKTSLLDEIEDNF